MPEKPGYYAIIPADVRYDKDLSSTEKLMYAEISALSNAYGFCNASNQYFANLYNMAIRHIQRVFSHLADKGYIRIEVNGKERKIFITGVTKMSWEGDKNVMVHYDKNVTHNNTSINNKFNNICSEQANASSEPPVITLTLNNKNEYPITQKYLAEMQELYPAVDVLGELKKMRAWCINNPRRRKTAQGITKFINAWLSREQDSGRKPISQQQQTRPGYYDCVNEDEYRECIGFTVER